jgi:hypothetical protein
LEDLQGSAEKERRCQNRTTGLSGGDELRQHLLDLHRNPVAIDQHDAARNRKRIGQDLDFVCFRRIEFDDGTPAQPHDLVNRHRGGSQNHHEIDTDLIESWHRKNCRTDKRGIAWPEITTLELANG